MGWIDQFSGEEGRSKLLRLIFALGCFATLPIPHPSLDTRSNVVLFGLWFFQGLWVWSLWFKPDYTRLMWLGAFVFATIGFFGSGPRFQAVLLLLWLGWSEARTVSVKRRRRSQTLKALVFGACALSIFHSQAQEPLSEDELRKMEESMGDLSDLTGSTPAPEKKKKKKKESPPAEKVLLPEKKISESAEAKSEASAASKGTATKETKSKEKKTSAKKVKAAAPKSAGAYDPSKYDNVDDLSELPKSEKELILKNLPKPDEEKQKNDEAKAREDTVVDLPKYLTGLSLQDFSSCSVYDKIPWKFSPDRRKKRLLIRDKMRHQTEAVFKMWEVYQVMDGEGFVTYIFRHPMAEGRYETIAIKDTVYNRFVETSKGKKQTEVQDLKTLVNRPALSFYTQDNSTLSVIPSSIGRTALVIQQGKAEGRVLPPLYLRGNTCDRPEDDENADQQAKKNAGTDKPATGSGGSPAPK